MHHVNAVHERKKSYTCPICKKVLSSKHYIDEHISTVHEGIRPYECSICGKTYPYVQSRDSHMLSVHYKVRPFQCPICEKRFVENKKMNTVHGEKKNENEFCENRPYKCMMCSYAGRKKQALYRHEKMHHKYWRSPQNSLKCAVNETLYRMVEFVSKIIP